MKINKKVTIVILNIINCLAIVPSILLWIVIGYVYDSPFASFSLIQRVFITLVLAIPAVVLPSVFFAVKSYKSGKYNDSYRISILTFLYIIFIVLGFVFMPPNEIL